MCRIFVVTRAKRKMAFFEGCPLGWGGYPPDLAWWTGGQTKGLDQEKVGLAGWVGTHRSWLGGARARGGGARASVPGGRW